MELAAGTPDPSRPVRGALIHDPLEEPARCPGAVVLCVGVAGAPSVATLTQRVAALGAAAVVVRSPVAVDDKPRAAIAVRAGGEILGSIWVIIRDRLGPDGERALAEAANVAVLRCTVPARTASAYGVSRSARPSGAAGSVVVGLLLARFSSGSRRWMLSANTTWSKPSLRSVLRPARFNLHDGIGVGGCSS
ncbi:hypothetical protein ACWGI1_17790 [Streptomyces sp. NPDC054835]